MKKKLHWKIIATLVVATFMVAGCEVEQTREAELPDVDVDVEAGQLPAWDIDGPDVNVGVREKTVQVPKVQVVMEKETITVPYVDVELPEDSDVDVEERELAVEFDVDRGDYDIEISEIRAKGDRIYVIAELEEIDLDVDKPERVSDRLILNAPEGDVRYYVIGKRPEGASAGRYKFVASESALPQAVRDARTIYSS